MLNEVEADVLDLLVEDDYGLWEIAWRVGGAATAAHVVERLCQRGLAQLCVREWLDDTPLPLDRSRFTIDLLDPATWEPPSGSEAQVLLSATQDGQDMATGGRETS